MKMKAIILPKHGGTDVLDYIDDFEKPSPQKGEVLVKVAVSGINNVDSVNRVGYPGIVFPLPHILGADIAGTVVELGEGVDNVALGTKVIVYPLIACNRCQLCHEGRPNICLNWKFFGLHLKGGYAEYVSVPQENIIPLPLPFDEAPAVPVAGLTAYHALKTVGQLRDGQTFFIWGGSGGLGTIAIQVAKYLGATVIATAGSKEKLDVMSKLGADYVFNRKTDDIPAEVKKIAPNGVDLLMDYVGPETFDRSFGMLKKGGTMLLCGIITGRETNFSIHQAYLRHLSVKGLYMGSKAEMIELIGLMEQGKILPHIGKILPLKDAAIGHELMDRGESIGKITLRVE
jgi:NADPH:quinone reductase-like Zn-dependent oxidoreductase